VAFQIKKSQLEPKTSGLTLYGVMRLRLLLDDFETTESLLEPSETPLEAITATQPQLPDSVER